MKILKLVYDLGLGGTQRCAQNYALLLADRGHDVRVMGINGLGTRSENLREKGIRVSQLKQEDLVSELKSFVPDVVHIHRRGCYEKSTTELLKTIRKFFVNLPIVETNVFSRVDYSLGSGVINVHLHLSDWCKVKFDKWARCLSYKPLSTVVPYSIDPKVFRFRNGSESEVLKKNLGISTNSFLIGRIGQASEPKWDSRIIDCFIETDIPNSCLLLVSPPDSHLMKVASLPKKIRERIIIKPLIESDSELNSLLSGLDLFLHMSKIGESFGMVIAEAILCGVPVLTLATPLKDNTQAILVRQSPTYRVVRKPSCMKSTLLEMYSMKDKLNQTAHLTRDELVDAYSPSSVGDMLEAVYSACIDKEENLVHYINKNRPSLQNFHREFKMYPLITRILFASIHTADLYKLYSKYKLKH